jgi:hypothetical protein
VQDVRSPSVATIVAGAPVRGSWWAHPKGKAIWRVLASLAAAEMLFVKLVRGKVTLLHRRLWPALYSIATSMDAWQMAGLSPAARALFARVQRAGALRTDDVRTAGSARELSRAATELEARLLVHGREVHTDAGTHARDLKTWRRWAGEAGVDLRTLPSAAHAWAILERAAAAAVGRTTARGLLPWLRPARTRARTRS